MPLRLTDHWVWDSWVADDGDYYHLFFLRAARSLMDPLLRHQSAAIGHAVSTDLRSWRVLPDALVAADGPAWDDMATWTGSVVRGPDGTWWMFYSGLSRSDGGRVQRIGAATSPDLMTWTRGNGPPLEADPRWYEKVDSGVWHEEAWRDPFVIADPAGDGWHMLITARARSGPADGRGVIGYARSSDLRDWEVRPPLTTPAGFGHLEVAQSRVVDGVPVLVFSCQPDFLSAARRADTRTGDVWFAPGESRLGPWDFDRVHAVAHPSLYAGQLLRDRDGQWLLLGFRNLEDGEFVGEIVDPIHVRLQDGGLRVISDEPGGQ
jgi:beta-fructofuranosidase